MKYNLIVPFFLLSLMSFAQKDIIAKTNIEVVQKQELGYALHFPLDSKEKKPLIIFLHGSGENGSDVEKVKIHGPFKYLKNHDIDAYVLAPQCPEGQQWNSDFLYQLILKIQKENNIDENRIYITGLSSGGWGTWSLALKHPEMFAAIVPVSGFVDLNQLEEICKIDAVPVRIFHGLMDDVVPVANDLVIYKELKKCNKDVELTLFNDAGHDCWTQVYDNPQIYAWMLKQIKKDKK
ncbi:prolyl oligopeptidase family serine peptidase [Flavobacterium aquiphilum]|uniref:carboxylesterase family protein n=1 Tax=Flavobacterium aquiphilum TaxID=3003261 RepID=UPI0024818AE6|nr:prolyl oligopeptidase family serine peptidase [Flavobacterium aquiphilum]